MTLSVTRRKFIGLSAQTAAAAMAAHFFVVDSQAQVSKSKYANSFQQLDVFVEQYMREMNSPGMTLVMADRDGVQRVVTYGFSDPAQKISVKPEDLFEIGSISKSFVAHCLLQLRQEGKIDFNKPIAEYLPWFKIDSAFAPITTHHLLTHTSGLPDDAPLFLSDPSDKHRAAYAPGEHFHYCNLAYAALGYLVWILDGRELPEVFRKRVFEPLGMTQSEPVISLDVRARLAKNYRAFQTDRPYPRHGRLSEAPGIVMTNAAGCIASTPHDMGLYIQMIANHGKGPKGELLSSESFALFSQPHIKAEVFGPTASYGYGIAVDTLDGHKIARHTGGMISFASAIHVDVDEGVGAFASINAMQGYRPNPVAQYAMQLMRAQHESKTLAAPPLPDPPAQVKNAADYAGKYEGEDGRTLEFAASGDALFLLHRDARIPLQHEGGDTFIAPDSDFERFAIVFARADVKDPKSAVVEVGWSGDWFANSRYAGPKKFEYPKEWDRYTGHYRNENPWTGSVRIVLRKGRLMMDGVLPLEPGEGGIFFPGGKEHNPEWVRFGDIVNAQAMRLTLSGDHLWRVTAP
jgi:CubicO group peptidase (beta-lactamase class C family)